MTPFGYIKMPSKEINKTVNKKEENVTPKQTYFQKKRESWYKQLNVVCKIQ
jgi:hypothetical protein